MSKHAGTADAHTTYLEAVAERRRMIEKLTACSCCWPIVRYRNGDGHDPECPAHTALTDGEGA